ncbi:MAG: (d)CMP kinase [Christensenellales bacterium]|jgi:cytidylate kinase
MRLNIAIDGPAGAGKSTLAKALARSLNIHYLDTGAMYRAVAYTAVSAGINVKDEQAVARLLEDIDLKTVYVNGEQQILLNGVNVMPYIRTPEMSTAASDISALPCVRKKLVEMQREVAKQYDVVLDGRDIGTYVLPDAPNKFFLTADPAERARRRHAELLAKGIHKDYNDVLSEMLQRDANDSSRALAPLKKADDAILIDATYLDADAVLSLVLSKLKQE